MNIWRGGNKKSRKQESTVEDDASAIALPDVIAGLSLTDISTSEMAENLAMQMPSISAASAEAASINYAPSQYPESNPSEPQRGRRRPQQRLSHHQTTFTPQGLGAGGFSTNPQELGIIPAPPQSGNSRRQETFQGWGSQQQQQEFNSSISMTNSYISPEGNIPNITSLGPAVNTLLFNRNLMSSLVSHAQSEGVRIRSMSSEPRAPQSGRGDRRERCSSATRNHQPRHRPKHSEQHHQPLFPPASPPKPVPASSPQTVSPPFQQIHYQQTPTASTAMTSVQNQSCSSSSRAAEMQDNRVPSRENPSNMSSPQTDLNRPGASYGYEVPDLDALLTQASPHRPANLPMVLASSTRLHNMRITQEDHGATGQPPTKPFLPLGIIVNAVFKTRDWLYVRTAHGAEGYVPYSVCLPLGILPPSRPIQSSSTTTDASNSVSPWELRDTEGLRAPTSSRVRNADRKSHHQPLATNTLDGHHRSRPRGRRRHHIDIDSNQTDHQKLQPSTRGTSESRRLRETFDPPNSSAPHIV